MTHAASVIWKRVKKTKTCWLWIGCLNKSGYGNTRYQGKAYRAHRLSYLLTYGSIPDGKMICHKCNVRNCVRPSHLYAGDHSTNTLDMIRAGTWKIKRFVAYGQDHPISKLRNTEVKKIVRLYRIRKWSHRTLAARFGVARRTIARIVQGECWSHLTGVHDRAAQGAKG